MVTIILIILHLYSNYKAVTALIFKNLNNLRITLILKGYLLVNAALGPESINKIESVFLGFGGSVEKFCGFKIVLGCSLKKVLSGFNPDELKGLINVYRNRKYLLLANIKSRCIYVAFEKGESASDVISAYYNAVLLGIATCIYNKINLVIHFSSKKCAQRFFFRIFAQKDSCIIHPLLPE